jgi:hypothetical protein
MDPAFYFVNGFLRLSFKPGGSEKGSLSVR